MYFFDNGDYLGYNRTTNVYSFNIAGALALTIRGTSMSSDNPMRVGSSGVPDASAVLDASSTEKGFKPPAMDTTQRDAIATPATGLLIYNTTTGQYEDYNGASWVAVGPAGTTNALLDGSNHTDTLADSVTDGDIIIGNVTPKWSSLAIAIPAANVRNVLGVDNGELRPSWKASLDGTNPADLGVAAPGTSLIAAHRDHVHLDPVTAHVAAADPHTGYVLESLLDAKGDLIAASADNTPAKLTVGANNTVVIAASGEAAGLKYDYVYDEVTITVENPTASENIVVRQFTQAITITAIQAVVIGGTSVTIDPEHGSTITTATKLLSAAEEVATASTTGEHIGGTGTAMAATFNDATLAAGYFLRLETTAISGTPTLLSVTFKYRLT